VSKDGVTTTSTEVSQDKWGQSPEIKVFGRSSLWFDPRANHDALPDCPRGRGMEKDVGCQAFCTRPSSHQYQLLGDAQLRQLAEGEDYFQYQPGTAWRGRGPKKWDELLQIALLRVIPTLTYYSGILSDILSDIYSDIICIWHSIWHLFWHSFCRSFWHYIWHVFKSRRAPRHPELAEEDGRRRRRRSCIFVKI